MTPDELYNCQVAIEKLYYLFEETGLHIEGRTNPPAGEQEADFNLVDWNGNEVAVLAFVPEEDEGGHYDIVGVNRCSIE